jgi:hypothetical protein
MARQVIVLDVRLDSVLSVTAAFWLVVPVNMVKPSPGAGSALPLSTAVSWGITPAELLAIQAGTVREMVTTITGPKATTALQAQAALASAYGDQQAALNAVTPGAKWIGAFFDGTTWTAAP